MYICIGTRRPCGIALADGSEADVFANTVSENSPYGVVVMDTACGHVYNNSITRNDLAQVRAFVCHFCVQNVMDNGVPDT